jgi:tripartite-type tricarboxylate transporter receptor subunit TctC
MSFLRTLLVLHSLLICAICHSQTSFPDRPVKLIVPVAAGGGVDTAFRTLAPYWGELLGQPVVVENRPGAGQVIGIDAVAKAKPDGYTLAGVGVPIAFNTALGKKLPYDPIKDFSPIARVTTFDFAVTTGPGAPSGDVKSLMAWLKANPGKANYATSGAGTVPHFAGQLLAQETSSPMTHVAYKGGAPAAQDLIGGQIPVMIDTASETLEHHKTGKVKIVAVTGEARSLALPEVPTLKEMGINVVADAFFGLYGPAGMQADRTQKISDAVAQALNNPEIQNRIKGFGLVPSYANAAALSASQATHLKRWEAPIKASGYIAE